MVSRPICNSLEQKRKNSADIEKCRNIKDPKRVLAVSLELNFSLNVSIVKRFYSNDILVHVFKDITDCNHHSTLQKIRAAP